MKICSAYPLLCMQMCNFDEKKTSTKSKETNAAVYFDQLRAHLHYLQFQDSRVKKNRTENEAKPFSDSFYLLHQVSILFWNVKRKKVFQKNPLCISYAKIPFFIRKCTLFRILLMQFFYCAHSFWHTSLVEKHWNIESCATLFFSLYWILLLRLMLRLNWKQLTSKQVFRTFFFIAWMKNNEQTMSKNSLTLYRNSDNSNVCTGFKSTLLALTVTCRMIKVNRENPNKNAQNQVNLCL